MTCCLTLDHQQGKSKPPPPKKRSYFSFYSSTWVLCSRPWVEYEYLTSLYSNSLGQLMAISVVLNSTHCNQGTSCNHFVFTFRFCLRTVLRSIFMYSDEEYKPCGESTSHLFSGVRWNRIHLSTGKLSSSQTLYYWVDRNTKMRYHDNYWLLESLSSLWTCENVDERCSCKPPYSKCP